jgi:predicted MFS family arabinose efflux permease
MTLIGDLLEGSLYRTLVVIPLLMAAIGLCLMAFGSSVPAVTVLLGIWGLIVAVVQLAIASGATLGGVLFDASGYRASFGLSVAVLVPGAALAWLAARSAREGARAA